VMCCGMAVRRVGMLGDVLWDGSEEGGHVR
jgi:hypothetical protein